MQGNEGKRWAICIGINDYEAKGILDLKKARNDAKGLAKILQENGQFDKVYVFTDELTAPDGKRNDFYATKSKIMTHLDFLSNFIQPQDLVVFHFSGHGIMDSKGNGYLIPVDGAPGDFFRSSIPVKTVTSWLQRLGVRKSLLILDACRESLEINKGVSQNGLKAEQFNRAEVSAVFYATKAGKYSYEDDSTDYGAFTRYIIDGLSGRADEQYDGNKDGIITFKELQGFVEQGVTDWALSNSKLQIPYTQILGEQTGNLALSIAGGGAIPSISPVSSPVVSSPGYENMARILGGSFEMGSNDGSDDEKPVHTVTISQFWMDKHEVTNGEYKKCVDTGSCRAPESVKSSDRNSYYGDSRYENYPVINVSWDDARKYCQWKGKRLPTEAEWEYAARGGLSGARYPNGDNINCGDANYCRSSYCDDCKGYGGKDDDTHPVGSYTANGYGLYDMAGNVWEWVSDWYEENYYRSSPPRDPQGPTSGTSRVVRGGSWVSLAVNIRVSSRSRYDPTAGASTSGFVVPGKIKCVFCVLDFCFLFGVQGALAPCRRLFRKLRISGIHYGV